MMKAVLGEEAIPLQSGGVPTGGQARLYRDRRGLYRLYKPIDIFGGSLISYCLC